MASGRGSEVGRGRDRYLYWGLGELVGVEGVSHFAGT